MAMSKENISHFQDVIRCDLCIEAAAQLHCDTCQVYVCNACVSTHITSDLSKQHLVVECKKRSKIKLTECKSHAPQRCDLKCKKCNVPVCSKCMASTHANHTVIDIIDFCKTKQEEIRQENKQIQSIKISELENAKSKIKEQIASLPKLCAKTKENISKHGKEWHKEVDFIINTFTDNVDKMMDTDLNTLLRHQQTLEEMICLADQILRENAAILKSRDASAFDMYKSRLEEVTNISLNFDVNEPRFIPLQIDKKNLENCFGELKSGSVVEEETDYTTFVAKWDISDENSSRRKVVDKPLCEGEMKITHGVSNGMCKFCKRYGNIFTEFYTYQCTACSRRILSCNNCMNNTKKSRRCKNIPYEM